MQMDHIEHGAEIDPAAQHRVDRRQTLDEPFVRQCHQRGGAVLAEAELAHQGASALQGIARALCGDLLAAHRGRGMEQAACLGHRHEGRDLGSPSGLAEHHYPVRITAECADMVAYPFQRTDKVELSGIAAVNKSLAERRKPSITEQVDPMVDADDHDIAFSGKVRTLRNRICDGPPIISAAMEIDHHRASRIRARIGRPDIEEETILAHFRRHGIALRAQGSELSGRCLAVRQRLADRSVEPLRAGISNAPEGGNSAVDETTIIQCTRIGLARCSADCGRTQKRSAGQRTADGAAPSYSLTC